MAPAATVADVMTRLVVTTRPDERLDAAARLLREFHVSGLPVVDARQRVVGVLSEKDLVSVLSRSVGIDQPRGLLDLLLESAPRRGESLLSVSRHRLHNARVVDAMSRPAITIGADASIPQAARLMRARGVNRLPVVDRQGQVVGILTRADVLEALEHRPRRSRGRLHPPANRRKRPEEDPFADV
ncbi:MAG: CBS domain-containing protein [Thermoplasmata archaeon]